jgi:hypothetical protein
MLRDYTAEHERLKRAIQKIDEDIKAGNNSEYRASSGTNKMSLEVMAEAIVVIKM